MKYFESDLNLTLILPELAITCHNAYSALVSENTV